MADIIDSAPNEEINTRPLLGASGTPEAFAEVDSRPLQELYGLTTNLVCNIVFIAIDFENIANIKKDLSQNLDSEVGLAILDVREFDSVPSTELISTYNFASGSSDYQERARKTFLFGKSIAITQDDMLESVRSLLPTDRQLVFVGHDIKHDLRALDLLDFDFSTFKITILDTQSVSAEITPHESLTLRRLLLTFGCPFVKLHCGGNDANFTSKALLLLAIRDCVKQSGIERRLATMKEIALNPLPYHVRLQTETTKTTSTDSQTRAAKKRVKRSERSRKHQSKLWDNENSRENPCGAGC